MTPKYTRIEYERRFLVDTTLDWQSGVRPYSKLLEDRYLACGRLRLRRMEDSDTGLVVFKLTKKFDSDSLFSQPVVSVWLSAPEYDALAMLPNYALSKRRYYNECDGAVFSIDVFHGKLNGLVICETECESLDALRATSFPLYARWEVTEDSFFTGGSLSRADQAHLEAAMTGRARFTA